MNSLWPLENHLCRCWCHIELKGPAQWQEDQLYGATDCLANHIYTPRVQDCDINGHNLGTLKSCKLHLSRHQAFFNERDASCSWSGGLWRSTKKLKQVTSHFLCIFPIFPFTNRACCQQGMNCPGKKGFDFSFQEVMVSPDGCVWKEKPECQAFLPFSPGECMGLTQRGLLKALLGIFGCHCAAQQSSPKGIRYRYSSCSYFQVFFQMPFLISPLPSSAVGIQAPSTAATSLCILSLSSAGRLATTQPPKHKHSRTGHLNRFQ